MLRWLIRRKLDAEEKKLGVSVDYLRHVVDISPVAFLRFAGIMPFVNSRKALPKDAWYVAQIATLTEEDCGPCVQIAVNLARQDGVSNDTLQAALDGSCDRMSQDMADVFRFAKSVLAPIVDENLRETIRSRYGERGLIELSYAIAGSRIPPTIKRTLGYAKSCSEVTVRV